MKTRHLLGSLLVAGALVAVGLWLSSGTVKAPQPQVPEATSCAAPANDVHTLPGRSQVNEAPPKNAEPDIPPEPPPAPLDNDPAAGRVWLRVVDADTQQPLADTQVELFPAGRDNNGSTFGYLNDATRPAPRRTDAEGRLALTVSPLEGEPDEDADVAFDDFARQASRLYVPVPPGWYPLVGTFRLGLAIYELTAKPTDAPIDVPVRRFASLTVNVRDQSGVPVSDAQLRLNVLTDSYEDTDWHDVFSGLPRAESRLFSPPKEDAVERELLPRQIVCKWNGEEKTEAELQEEMEDGDVEDLGFRPVGSFGTTEFDALPRLTVVAFAWHRLYGVVSARMDLGADANTLEVVFPNTRTAELHVRVNWSPKPDNPEDEIEVMLTDSGPYGRTGPLKYADEGTQLQWEVPAGDESSELVLTGVPAGWWHLAIPDVGPGAGVLVELAPGESKTVQLLLGDDTVCRWTPIIRCDGEQLAEADLVLIGGGIVWRNPAAVRYDAATGKTSPIELSPGEWTALVPTLPPFHFTLKPGETRSDVFELKVLNVQFAISGELAALLGEPDEAVGLELEAVGDWRDAAHLRSLRAGMHTRDAGYEQLLPDATTTWFVPTGEYEWSLTGSRQKLKGRIRFSADGPTKVKFDLQSLPGCAVLEVELVGFEADQQPQVTVDDAEGLCIEPADHFLSTSMYLEEPTALYHDLFDPLHASLLQVDGDHYVVFAPPGTVAVQVKSGDRYCSSLAKVPGKLVVNAKRLAESEEPEVLFVEELANADDPYAGENDFEGPKDGIKEIRYDIEMYGDDGWFWRSTDWSAFDVPHGTMRVIVHRAEYLEDDSCRNFVAQFEVNVQGKLTVVELGKQKYTPYATLDLVFKGHGSPEQCEDAWWFPEQGPRAPRLVALDMGQRVVKLDYLSEYMPDGRLEFTFRDMLLPPGHYRLIPWPGAAPKDCREFSLKPGEHSTIITQGS